MEAVLRRLCNLVPPTRWDKVQALRRFKEMDLIQPDLKNKLAKIENSLNVKT